nr:hypothetical protein CFP56_08091 [Quercus suber]
MVHRRVEDSRPRADSKTSQTTTRGVIADRKDMLWLERARRFAAKGSRSDVHYVDDRAEERPDVREAVTRVDDLWNMGKDEYSPQIGIVYSGNRGDMRRPGHPGQSRPMTIRAHLATETSKSSSAGGDVSLG